MRFGVCSENGFLQGLWIIYRYWGKEKLYEKEGKESTLWDLVIFFRPERDPACIQELKSYGREHSDTTSR